jgi:hypothetical protein
VSDHGEQPDTGWTWHQLQNHLIIKHGLELDTLPESMRRAELDKRHDDAHWTNDQVNGEALMSRQGAEDMMRVAGLADRPDMSLAAIRERLSAHDPYWATRSLVRDIEALLGRLDEAHEVIGQRSAHIKGLRRDLRQAEGQMGSYRQMLADAEQEIARLQQMYRDQAEELHTASERLSEKPPTIVVTTKQFNKIAKKGEAV